MSIFIKYTKRSRDQFVEDFGGELQDNDFLSHHDRFFCVVNTSGFVARLYCAYELFRFVLSNSACSANPRFLEFHIYLEEQKREIKEAAKQYSSDLSGSGILSKAAHVLIWIFLMPFVVASIVGFIFFAVWKFFQATSFVSNSLGYYHSIFGGGREVVLQARKIEKSHVLYDAVLSHEHFHLVQHEVFLERSGSYRDPDCRQKLALFMLPEYAEDDLALYFMSLDEVEPRLHEVVLSFYRKYATLPLNYNGYLNMMLSVEGLGEAIFVVLSGFDDVAVQEPNEYFALRESSAGSEIGLSIRFLSDAQIIKRFFCEALAVIYGNLLMVYGGSELANRYLSTVKDHNLYYEMYGPLAIGRDPVLYR